MIDYMGKFSLSGKTIVVCGGLGLLGSQVSHAVAQAGAHVLILDIHQEFGEKLQNELSEKGQKATFIKFDITNFQNYSSFVNALWTQYGPIHGWINTAYPRTKDWGHKLENVSISSWIENVNIQMNSYCLLSREIAEKMKEFNIKGTIINYGSTYGVVSPDFETYAGTEMTSPAAYSAIKGGVINFSRYLASYYGKYGIRVNCLCPGGIFDNQNPLFVQNYKQRTPLQRMGNPDEIASATLFLVSDASSYITGSVFMVDGGWTCI